jgi:hypothetical protein
MRICKVRKRDQFVNKGRNEEWVRNGADVMFRTIWKGSGMKGK